MATPEPSYTIVMQQDNFSIRNYPPQLVATVTLKAGEGNRNTAFRILADYIFRNAQKKSGGTEKIGMTAPVTVDETPIGMTAPVSIDDGQSAVTMVFYMPKRYTSSTLPIPKDSRIVIREEPQKTVAVNQFSGFFGDDKFATKSLELKAWLEKKWL